MRWFKWVVLLLVVSPSWSPAEDKPNPDALKKAYDDALAQLKAAQDSKNALAKQNADLLKELDDLKKRLAGAGGQIQELRRQVADNEEKTFELRSFYAAWKTFLRLHPDLTVRWKLFLSDDALSTPQEPLRLIDPNWLLLDPQVSASPD